MRRYSVQHREGSCDEERQKEQRRIDRVRFTKIGRQPQRDVEQSEQDLHATSATPVPTATRTRDDAGCAHASANAPAAEISVAAGGDAVEHLHELAGV